MEQHIKHEADAQAGPSPQNGSQATATATDSPLPSSSDYTDFLLRSAAPPSASGWKHHVMKLTTVGDRVIDPADESAFLRPVKLNRKDPRTVRKLTDEDRERHNKRALERAARAAGQDPNAMDLDVKNENGQSAGDAAGDGNGDGDGADKEELDPELVGKGVDGTNSVPKRGPRGQFKKKFQRVYVASEEARRLKREEWQPWVLEDDEGRERWVGRLEGGAGEVGTSAGKKGGENAGGPASDQGRIAPSTSTGNGGTASLDGWRPTAEASATGGGGSAYVAFVFGDNGDEFKAVPINRWYRFNQGPKYLTLAEEEAEAEVCSSRLPSTSGPTWLTTPLVAVRPSAKVERPGAMDHASASRSAPGDDRDWLCAGIRRRDPARWTLVPERRRERRVRKRSPLPHARAFDRRYESRPGRGRPRCLWPPADPDRHLFDEWRAGRRGRPFQGAEGPEEAWRAGHGRR